jgi:hypothetical protein
MIKIAKVESARQSDKINEFYKKELKKHEV